MCVSVWRVRACKEIKGDMQCTLYVELAVQELTVLAKKFTTPLLAEECCESEATEDKSEQMLSNSPASTGGDSEDKSEQVPSNSPSSTGNDSNDGHQGNSQPSCSASIPIESLDTLELVSHKISYIHSAAEVRRALCEVLLFSEPVSSTRLSYSAKTMQQL